MKFFKHVCSACDNEIISVPKLINGKYFVDCVCGTCHTKEGVLGQLFIKELPINDQVEIALFENVNKGLISARYDHELEEWLFSITKKGINYVEKKLGKVS